MDLKNGANLQSGIPNSASILQEIGLFQKECKVQKSVSWLFSEDLQNGREVLLKVIIDEPRHQA
jgi:hypothetical protein